MNWTGPKLIPLRTGRPTGISNQRRSRVDGPSNIIIPKLIFSYNSLIPLSWRVLLSCCSFGYFIDIALSTYNWPKSRLKPFAVNSMSEQYTFPHCCTLRRKKELADIKSPRVSFGTITFTRRTRFQTATTHWTYKGQHNKNHRIFLYYV